MNRRGFVRGVLGGLVGIVGAVTTRGYEPLAGEIKPTSIPFAKLKIGKERGVSRNITRGDMIEDILVEEFGINKPDPLANYSNCFEKYHTVGGSGSLSQTDNPFVNCVSGSGNIPHVTCDYNAVLSDNNPVLFYDLNAIANNAEEDWPPTKLLTLDGQKELKDIKDDDKVWTMADQWVFLKDCLF